jgi:4-diphosphocytidyl-2-C-methyl-D-erythritol kinase
VTTLAVAVPAKVNLHLEILGRRRDGFHEVRTLLQSIDLWDRVSAVPAPPGALELMVEPPNWVAADSGNTVLRAARELASVVGRPMGARIRLVKGIPVAAGLGGGSADAAAALVLLDRLWRTGLGPSDMQRLAERLGSDVPFFLHGGRAVGSGRGTEITELPDLDEHAVVVAVPPVRVHTAEVYARYAERLTCSGSAGTVEPPATDVEGLMVWSAMANDLETTVVDACDEVRRGLRGVRRQHPKLAGVSGSGAAVFGLFDSRDAAQRAASGLPTGWFVHVGRTLGRRAAAPRVIREG